MRNLLVICLAVGILTALTSFIGHLPILYAQGSGPNIQKPLAVGVMGGLVTSTALTLLLLPVIYLVLARKRGANANGAPVAGTAAEVAS